LPTNKLESAVTVNFPGLPSRPVRVENPLTDKKYEVQYQGFWEYLGYRFTTLHPLQLGTSWWFSNSPLNLVPPEAPSARAPKSPTPKSPAPKAQPPKATAPQAAPPKATPPKAPAPKAPAPKAPSPRVPAPKVRAKR
jgi:hypothetical protein